MPVVSDIGIFISCTPELHSGRPLIAGTGTSVRRIAVLYKQGISAEDIARRMKHLSLAQIYAALTYYHAHQTEIESDLAAEDAEYWRLAALHSNESSAHDSQRKN